jgi:hypothetical protein
MLFNLPALGEKDWYRWGAGFLSNSQNPGGWWQAADGVGRDRVISTAFALLFLNRSHPMKDLTPKLPFKAKELNQGISRLLSGAPLEPSTATPSRGDKPKR